MHDVFISYSGKDKSAADAVCHALEADGIRCWIAPRDIFAGKDWSESILTAILNCKLFVLVLSQQSSTARQVQSEVLTAVAENRIVVPLRIEDIYPGGALRLQLSGTHWLDAFPPPLDPHLKKLSETLRVLMGEAPQAPAPWYSRAPPPPPPHSSAPPPYPPAAPSSRPTSPPPPPVAPPPTPSMPVATPTGPNEIVFPASLPVTMGKVADAISRLGSVTEQNQSQQYVAGRIKFGLQSVIVRVSVVPVGPGQCRVVLQGSSDDVWGAGAKNATRRLMEMLRNLDNPGYKPDRLGIHPLALGGVIIGFVIILVIVMRLLFSWALGR